MFSQETLFTSTGEKLLKHLDAMEKFQKEKLGTPIVLHIMPTSVCNLKCKFCSVKDRVTKEILDLDKVIKPTVDELTKRGLKAVIISGGGEPTLYPKFEELINYLKSKNLEIGLITNGTLLTKYDNSLWEKFSWIRISINTLEYLKQVDIPKLKNPVVGFSYIVTKDTTDQMLNKIREYALRFKVSYVRLLPDCAVPLKQLLEDHKKVSAMAERLGPPFFHQYKIHSTPPKCYLGYFHPVLYCDGNIYPCDSLVLNDFENQQFKKEFMLCKASDIKNLYENKVKSLVDTKKMCPNCVFERQNRTLLCVLEPMRHENFI